MKKITTLLLILLLATFSLNGALSEEATLFGVFTAENLRGEEEITEAIFGEVEITIVNIWATWCPPCVKEIPDLAKIYDATEGRAQVLGILLDGGQYDEEETFIRDEEAIDVMHQMLDECEATFPVVLAEDPVLAVVSKTGAVPKSFIVNSKGEILETIIGALSESEWIKIIEKHAE